MFVSPLPLLNQLLSHQETTKGNLQGHAGRVLRLTLASWSLVWQVTESGDFKDASNPDPKNFDLEIEVPAESLIYAFSEPHKLRDQMRVNGNVAFAGTLMTVAESIPHALGAETDRLFGPVVSQLMQNTLRQLIVLFRAAHESLIRNLQHTLRDEQKHLVSSEEGKTFALEVNKLTQDLAQLKRTL